MANFTAPAPVRRATEELSTLLTAYVDLHNVLTRMAVPDPVTGRPELQDILKKYNVKLEPRSLYGEAAQGRVYERDRRA